MADRTDEIVIPEPKSGRFRLLKTKTFWIVTALALAGGWWVTASWFGEQGPFYETEPIRRGDLVRTVEVTGEVVPEARLSLAFKSGGSLDRIYHRVGRRVKAGDVIAELESRDLRFSAERARAALAVAQANLNARLAGATDEAIEIARAAVDQARAAHDKAQTDLEVTRVVVEDEYARARLAFDLAERNLANSGSVAEQAVVTSFENLRAVLQTALGPLRTGLTDGDAIIGIDNSAANDGYEDVLGIFDRPALEQAKQTYPSTKASVEAAEQAVRALSVGSSRDTILDAALKTRTALERVQLYLTYVQKTLAGSVTNINLTTARLEALQTGIALDITSVGGQLSAVVAAYEGARNADLTRQTSVDQLKNAYEAAALALRVAESDRTVKVKTAEANVAIQQAALDAALAALAEREAPPREADVAALRAQVLDAQTAYRHATERLADVRIVAPLDGIVTEILPEIGELVAANQPAVRMLATDGFSIEALVPEADIAKVEVGQSIEITLDAYGDTVKFAGTVMAENADQTRVQEAIYYKIYVDIDARDADLKAGMTANLTILTGARTNALIVPSRALRLVDDRFVVRVLEGREAVEREITIGLRGDEGRVELLSGLRDGEAVVTGELTAEEYRRSRSR